MDVPRAASGSGTHLPEPCDTLVLTTPESLVYFANYAPSPFVFNTVESAAALVLRPDRATLIGDNLLRPFLDASCVDEVIALEWYTGKKSAPGRQSAVLDELRSHLLPNASGSRIGAESLFLGAATGSRIVVLDPLIRMLRRSKDADELAILRESIRAGEAAHAAAMAEIKPGMTELDAYLLVSSTAARTLGKQVLVYGDFVSGPRCETERGGPPSRRVIQRGDLLLLDFSVVVHGYRGDFTNTFVVGDEPAPRQNELYQLCLGALEAGESMLRPGSRQDKSTPRCAATSPDTEWRSISPRTQATVWDSAIPNPLFSCPRARTFSRPTMWSHLNRACTSPVSAACASSGTT